MQPHALLRATPVCLAGALLALVACGYGTPTPPSPAPAAPPPENVLTPADQAAGWKLLFEQDYCRVARLPDGLDADGLAGGGGKAHARRERR